jgi:hypothetical protein
VYRHAGTAVRAGGGARGGTRRVAGRDCGVFNGCGRDSASHMYGHKIREAAGLNVVVASDGGTARTDIRAVRRERVSGRVGENRLTLW